MGRKNVNVVVGGPVNSDYPKVYNTVYIKPNIPFILQVTEPNTKYVIRHKIDLGGKRSTVSDIDFTNAQTHEIGGVTYYYVPFTADGNPYTLLDDFCVFITTNWNGLSARTITPEEGTVFMIGSVTGGLHTGAITNAQVITMPENCILEFDGGGLYNGILILNDTIILSEDKCFENIVFANWCGTDGIERFTFRSTIGNDGVHLKWFGDALSMNDLQNLFNFSIGAEKDADLDGKTITIDRTISLNNLIYHKGLYWWNIKNGTIIGDAYHIESIFTANNEEISAYPRYGCVVFDNISFINNSTIDNLPAADESPETQNIYADWMKNYDYTQPDNRINDDERDYKPLANKICVLSGNRLCRVYFNDCGFNGVCVAETGGYLQSIYISGCRLINLEYSFIRAAVAYDIHLTNNTSEYSLESVIADITRPESIEISGNLLEYIRAAVIASLGDGITITNNYFEGCIEHILKKEWVNGELNGVTFTGNTCFQLEYDIVSDGGVGEYHYIEFGGYVQGYTIMGNSFYVQSFENSGRYPRPTYTVKPLLIKNPERASGLFLAGRLGEDVGIGYGGNNSVKGMAKEITGSPDRSILDPGRNTMLVPVGGKSEDMGSVIQGDEKAYDPRIPSPGGVHRIFLDKTQGMYEFESNEEKVALADNLWKAIMMDSCAPYVPWSYVKRQLAEDNLAEIEGRLDPTNPEDVAIIQSPWFKQALIIDYQFGSDFLDSNLGKPGSRLNFSNNGDYYDGLMRFHPSNGLQWWSTDHWCNGKGFSIELKNWGMKPDRPFKVTKITDFPHTDGCINSISNIFENDNPSRYYCTLIDVTSYNDRPVQVDCYGCSITFLKEAPVVGEEVLYAEGWNSCAVANPGDRFFIPSDAKYLYILLRNGDVIYDVGSVAFIKDFLPYDYSAGFMFFDNSQNKPTWFSGNVYIGDDGWVDAMGNDPRDTITLIIGSFPTNSYALDYTTKVWSDNQAYNGCLINVEEHQGEYCKFTGGSAGMTFLKSEPVIGEAADYATGYGTIGYNDANGTVQIPADAKYLWIQTGSRKVDKIELFVRI